MYEYLVKRLRREAVYLPEKFSKNAELLNVLMKAADAIEELSEQFDNMNEANIALYGALPKWIPVREQLIHSGWYLVACNEWGGSAVRKAIYDEATRKWLEFPYGGPKDITKFVTHYMPLPQPPEGEEA